MTTTFIELGCLLRLVVVVVVVVVRVGEGVRPVGIFTQKWAEKFVGAINLGLCMGGYYPRRGQR